MKSKDPTELRTWEDGVNDAIKIVEDRLFHAELYRDGEALRTHPAVFAILDEVLIFLKAMLSRKEFKSRSVVD